MREVCGDDLEAVCFESNRYVAVDGEEIVNEDYVILARAHQEPAIPRKLKSEYSRTVSALILLQEH